VEGPVVPGRARDDDTLPGDYGAMVTPALIFATIRFDHCV